MQAARKAGKVTGIYLFDSEDYQKYHELGIRMIAYGSDASFIADGALFMSKKMKKLKEKLQK